MTLRPWQAGVLGGVAGAAVVAVAVWASGPGGASGPEVAGALGAVGITAAVAAGTARAGSTRRRGPASPDERRLDALVRNAADVIVVIDRDGRFAWVSPSAEAMFGVAPETVVGRRVLDVVTSDDARAAYRELATVRRGTTLRREVRLEHADGSTIHADLAASNLLDDSVVAGVVVTVHDITHRKAYEAVLAHQAGHDPLTGLPNRNQLDAALAAAQARAAGDDETFAVLYVDLDRFKAVNDRYGHDVGDAVLQQVAGRLRRNVREADTVVRVGGDEFVVVCPGASRLAAEHLGVRIGAAVEVPCEVNGTTVSVAASIGIALGDGASDDLAEVLRLADRAMLAAKGISRP